MIIGNNFSFNVQFQQWLKSNAGKTYADAVTAYRRILDEKSPERVPSRSSSNITPISATSLKTMQEKTLNDAIKCWKYKKSLKGHNRYEQSDLVVLDS